MNVRADVALKRLDGVMDAAPDLLFGEKGEKALNPIVNRDRRLAIPTIDQQRG